MPRYLKGQRPFEKLIQLRTCHEVRKLRACEHCQQMGHSDNMVQTDARSFSHGRCFIAKHGIELLVAHHRDQCGKLVLGDLGDQLSRALIDALHAPH